MVICVCLLSCITQVILGLDRTVACRDVLGQGRTGMDYDSVSGSEKAWMETVLLKKRRKGLGHGLLIKGLADLGSTYYTENEDC